MWKPTRALITGASSGLGESFARKLAAQGVNLVLVARRTDRLLSLSEELKSQYGVQVEYLSIDLSNENSAQNLFDFATAGNKKVDFLINNAGIGPYRPFLESSWEDHAKVINLNIYTLTKLCHLFSKHMIKHGEESSILNIASVASFHPLAKFSVYSGSKFFVRNFSDVIRYELRKTNISVSCLCPGGTATEFSQNNNQNVKNSGVLMDAEIVTDAGLRGAFKKKRLIIPGFLNKLNCAFAMVMPNSLNVYLSDKVMGMAISQRE